MSDAAVIGRPLPKIDDKLYAPYHQALKEHKLIVQCCEECGHMQWPPRELCFICHSNKLGWQETIQEGTVYTYTIVYRAFHPWFKQHLPYGVVVTELDNGIRMLANYFGPDVESLECGMRVKASFEDVDDMVTLLQWEKA